MKKIIYFLMFALFAITLYPQKMVVQKTDGTNIFLDMNTIAMINFIIPCPGTPTVDYGGKIYNTILIGNQCWLKENLDIGTMITGWPGNNSTIEKYCYDNNVNNCTTFGGLYPWDEAMQYVTTEGTQGICPTGWHIPTLSEFQILTAAVNNDGNSLKAIGQGTGGGAGTNTSGFSALLAGYRRTDGNFVYLGNLAAISSSTEYDAYNAYRLHLGGNDSDVYLIHHGKESGFSVRCLKD